MPRSRSYVNAFTKAEVNEYSKLSLPMIDYLCRHGYLTPTYRPRETGEPRIQGSVRYYSYRDLVIATMIQRLRGAGVRLAKLKAAMIFLKSDDAWSGSDAAPDKVTDAIKWLVFDGKGLHLRRHDGFLDELRAGGQRSFAFVVGLDGLEAEVRELIPNEKRAHFTMANRALIKTRAI